MVLVVYGFPTKVQLPEANPHRAPKCNVSAARSSVKPNDILVY